jgi:glutathione S-transferase
MIALYENATPFTPHIVDLMDDTSAAEFKKIWPIGKFPVLRDEARDWTVPESNIIIEYLDQHYPGATRLVPEDADLARQTRMRDRFFDLYVNATMQKIVTDRLRPEGQNDTLGVQEARQRLETAIGMLDQDMTDRTWAMGEQFSMADCAAAPSLFYANKVTPLAETHKNAAAYLDRLMQRPSFAQALEEARPYFNLFPEAKEEGGSA